LNSSGKVVRRHAAFAPATSRRGNSFAFPLPTVAPIPSGLPASPSRACALRPRGHTPSAPPTDLWKPQISKSGSVSGFAALPISKAAGIPRGYDPLVAGRFEASEKGRQRKRWKGGTRSGSPSKVALLSLLEGLLRRFAPRNARSASAKQWKACLFSVALGLINCLHLFSIVIKMRAQ